MIVLVTGSGGLIGSEAAFHWLKLGHEVCGIDNNMRKEFFGEKGDTSSVVEKLNSFDNYTHWKNDIRDREAIDRIISDIKPDVIIHTAAQPSHDKAASIPFEDFDTNAVGTLNLLEAARRHTPDVVFIHVSTNKVYGDGPNRVPMIEGEKRFDINLLKESEFTRRGAQWGVSGNGFKENFPIDNCLHSLFGASKVAADIMAQEYGKYFGMNVGVFRGGCLTGPQHAGVELHGFLSYIVKCAMNGTPYTIFGYKGKQVRDQIHSADVISAFEHFIANPRQGEVYNLGGGKYNSASILEVIDLIEELTGKRLNYTYTDQNRIGDHICYYTDMSKFKSHFPEWEIKYSLKEILREIIANE